MEGSASPRRLAGLAQKSLNGAAQTTTDGLSPTSSVFRMTWLVSTRGQELHLSRSHLHLCAQDRVSTQGRAGQGSLKINKWDGGGGDTAAGKTRTC